MTGEATALERLPIDAEWRSSAIDGGWMEISLGLVVGPDLTEGWYGGVKCGYSERVKLKEIYWGSLL